MALTAEEIVHPTGAGLYCAPGGFHIDPLRPVPRALVTHGHSDQARPGHGAVMATRQTLDIMALRYGEDFAGSRQVAQGPQRIGSVTVSFHPAGHVLGSAQILIVPDDGPRILISGDYCRTPNPVCLPWEPVPCDVFITEATFGLPVFRHPPAAGEIVKLLHSLQIFPERSHVVGVYALGKCQRIIALLRQAGYDQPIYVHGALQELCDLYVRFGVDLGELRPATAADKAALRGQIVLAPPSAIADRWARRLEDPVVALASGWMRVRQRAKQRGVELPLVISDHADWDELTQTLQDVNAPKVWVTHGREEALIRAATLQGRRARALSLVGFDEEEGE